MNAKNFICCKSNGFSYNSANCNHYKCQLCCNFVYTDETRLKDLSLSDFCKPDHLQPAAAG